MQATSYPVVQQTRGHQQNLIGILQDMLSENLTGVEA